MIFEYEGRRYDTTPMRQHVTQDPGIPMIFVDEAEQQVFVVTFDPMGQGVGVHRADAEEARGLAARFNIPNLPGAQA